MVYKTGLNLRELGPAGCTQPGDTWGSRRSQILWRHLDDNES